MGRPSRPARASVLTLVAIVGLLAPSPGVGQAGWPLRSGRTIFACLNTEALPGAVPNAVRCDEAARKMIADAYCQDIGRPAATGWDTVFIPELRDEARRSFRLQLLPDQSVRWQRFNDEQFIFARIDCA